MIFDPRSRMKWLWEASDFQKVIKSTTSDPQGTPIGHQRHLLTN